MVNTSSQESVRDLIEVLEAFEARIARVEHELGIRTQRSPLATEPTAVPVAAREPEDFEFEVGVNWFARFGIVALAIGLAFLLTFPYDGVSPLLPSVFGFVLVGILYGVGHILRNSNQLVSRYIVGGGLVLLYFAILRLYFFTTSPVLNRESAFECLPLLFGGALVIFGAVWRNSMYLFALSLVMGSLSVLVLGTEAGMLTLLPALALTSVVFAIRKDWFHLLMIGPVVSFVSFAIYAVNNPIVGSPVQLIQLDLPMMLLLPVLVVIHTGGQYIVSRHRTEDVLSVVVAGATVIPYYALLGLLTIGLAEGPFLLHHALAHVVLLASATLWWVAFQSRLRTFGFAMLGYLALSVVILRAVSMPDAFIWLEMQSLLVLSTAIWFRSRFIVIANFFLYLIILVSYVATVEGVNLIGLTIGVVALMSARIMNWQQERLELKTESMRNAYLGAAFLTFPFMLYRLVPSKYVSLAWVCVALLYYGLNFLIKAQKYRWMGHLTLLLTVLYTLVIGIIGLDATYRILSFLILGIVLLVASLVFARQRTNKASTERGTVGDSENHAASAGEN